MSLAEASPFDAMGGEAVVLRVAQAFYDIMERDEPELAALHQQTAEGRIGPEIREHFARFLVFWTGGPQDYLETRGHPRLRMRHARVPVDIAMRDAWVRCMSAALDEAGVCGDVRELLDARFKHVANFLRNVDEQGAPRP